MKMRLLIPPLIVSFLIVTALTGGDPTPTMVMFATEESGLENSFRDADGYGYPLYATETHPEGTSAAVFDASLEECLRLLYDNGWAKARPSVFGPYAGTTTATVMDNVVAGGHYTPNPEPAFDCRDCGTQLSEFLRSS